MQGGEGRSSAKQVLVNDAKAVGASIVQLGKDLFTAAREDPNLRQTAQSIKDGTKRVFDTSSANKKAQEQGKNANLVDKTLTIGANLGAEFESLGRQLKQKYTDAKEQRLQNSPPAYTEKN
ncbi:hypothetical protein Ciccas_006525 [Cichlidogyrus casuarinus]|uniref:Uncharacterized protein n=1 Tax=Cichlidogyrus casuarinus TaxID=1844966 RepID=A0ABD2Q5I0_9PLAT